MAFYRVEVKTDKNHQATFTSITNALKFFEKLVESSSVEFAFVIDHTTKTRMEFRPAGDDGVAVKVLG